MTATEIRIAAASAYVTEEKLRRGCESDSCEGYPKGRATVLDFDHLDGTTKRKNIADMVCKGYSLKTIKIEIEKCECICANCHRIRTEDRRLG